MKGFVNLVFSIFLFFGCRMNAEERKSPDYIKYVREITSQLEVEVKKEFNLVCVGGGGRMPHVVEEIAVKFSGKRKATIEEARVLEVKVIERFLQLINGHEKIHPFLKEYPFTAERTRVSISFDDKDGYSYSDGTVAYMSAIKGKIYYSGNDPIMDDLYDIWEESFQEAQKTVNDSEISNWDLRTHSPSAYEAYLDEFLESYVKEVRKEYGLVNLRRGGKTVSGIEELSVSFIIARQVNVDQARELEIGATEKLLQMVNADTILRPHLAEYPFKSNRAKVHISFQKYNHAYYGKDSVGVVYQNNDKIFYESFYSRMEGLLPRLHPMKEESYSDAVKALQKRPPQKI